MDEETVLLVLLAGFFLLGVPVMAIAALVRTAGLKAEVRELRAALRRLEARLTAAPATAAPAAAPPPPEARSSTPPPQPETSQSAPSESAPPQPPPVAPVPATAAPPAPTSAAPAGPARPRESLEQKLGGRAFAWIGALAVALAGVFLVKYSIDQGYLDPPVRVGLGGVLGMVLLVAGEVMRRRDARIAQAVSAAGVAVLFAALFAAVGLYDLLSRPFASVLGLAITATAVSLSLRQGPFVALLGLVGGTVAPLIVGGTGGGAPFLFAYLLALVAGVLVVVRHRGWWWLGGCALAAATLWPLLWFADSFVAADTVWVGLFLLGVAAAYLWAAWRRPGAAASDALPAIVWAASGLMAGLAGLLVVMAGYGWVAWTVLVAVAILQAGFARYRPRFTFLALLAPLAGLAAFAWWGLVDGQGIAAEPQRIGWTALAVAGTMAAAAFALMWNAPRPGFWAALAGATAFLHFAVVVASSWDMAGPPRWGLVSVLLGLPFLAAAERVARHRRAMAGAEEALGFLAVAVTFFISAAVPLELRREWITLSYAIELPAVAWIAWRLNLPILRWLCWLLAATVTVRLVLNPYVLSYDVSTPILNWVLYGYGVAIAAYWLAARLLRRAAVDTLVLFVEASILAFAFLLLTLEVRTVFHPDDLSAPVFGVMEIAWTAVSWGAFACGLIYAAWQRPQPVLVWGWRIVGGAAAALSVLGLTFRFDGLFADGSIGRMAILNGLLAAFGLAALLAAAAAWMLGRMGQRRGALVAGIVALIQGFALLSYQVRHWFNFADGRFPGAALSDAELYAYSIVWLVFGAALLLAGIARRSAVLRYASLAVLVLVVGKVFLVDMSGLTGLLRVFSFLGLGVALLALGFLYRRYVFRDESAAAG